MSRHTRASGFALALLMALVSNRLAHGTGLLVPTDPGIPPLRIVYQRVNVEIRDQATVTRVEQEFRNHTSRALEAYYLFPLPAGAGVKDFSMWIDGKRIKGEVVEAARARQIYEDIVRRMKDPGLLEHMGKNLWRVRVFPVPAQGVQKIEINYSEIVGRDAGVAEYIYPLKTGNQSTRTERDFTMRIELHSSAPIKSVYSPSHAIGVSKEGEFKAIVGFEANQYPLDRDFHLFWTSSDKDVGLALLTHRESPGDAGYFLLMLSPKTEVPKGERVPRDIVFVLDTSGSMQGEKIQQAKNALEFCLKALDPADRFNLIAFSTTVNEFERSLVRVNDQSIRKAVEWVKELAASGGTAIDDAVGAALKSRSDDARNFTVVFLTDGLPTIGETEPKTILEKVKQRNTAMTRIFVFGVGDDVNTHLLDQLAELTRATSVYVRPKENLEAKVSSFYAKISHPVLADLSLVVGDSSIRFSDMFPPKLPDLFHGSQLLVLGRYSGSGHTSVRLEGRLAGQRREFVYEATLPDEKRENDFLPGLWARRKVGYLLDQIRLKGENKELVDEVIHLAKRYGIATPYTSYLVVPDQPVPPPIRPLPEPRRGTTFYFEGAGEEIIGGGAMGGRDAAGRESGGLGGGMRFDRARRLADPRQARELRRLPAAGATPNVEQALEMEDDLARLWSTDTMSMFRIQSGGEAVDVAEALSDLKKATGADAYAVRKIGATTFVNVGGVWIDQAYKKGAKLVRIKYLGKAYFRILELAPDAKKVFALGSRVVWMTAAGHALAIDAEGQETLSDDEIRSLVRVPRK
jgi:Ca-activated chloride channel family protein